MPLSLLTADLRHSGDMRTINRAHLLHWIAPVAVAGLLVGGTITVNAFSASAGTAGLPMRTAAQLIVDVEQAKLTGLSGTVVQSSDLGVPSLPGIGSNDSSSMTSLITGTHTLRVWYDGTDKSRVALLGSLGETDVIKNGSDLWTWSSKDNTATHRTVPLAPHDAQGQRSKPGAARGSVLDPTNVPRTPQDAANAALGAIDPSTIASTDANQSVAGRAVYQLTLRPRSPATTGSLIDRVSIAIDGATHIPLRVQVFGAGGSDPAFEIAFSSVDFTAPDAAQFNFTPPPGAQVTQATPNTAASKAESGTATARHGGQAVSGTHLVGQGWTSVLVASSSAIPSVGQLGRVLQSLPKVSGSWGSGHLLAGTVFSMLITDSGKVAIGAVAPDLLYSALAVR